MQSQADIEALAYAKLQDAAEESKFIVRINVYGPNEQAEPESDNYIVLEQENIFT